ncbi:hypothetical protein ATE92_0972 [Ulvibacter sp. MAR_2010_11]|uniref:hypothetical protein n=1 Tax=Ulvibacter sp. MAR_2010_11 TaxID=1250229 RepID=UPI000C2CB8D1|nr:hypothetical protein [Ulvibacter sp. MAR_2010_11]PKA82832.1 hypothetical protein ATE92_0972 [Ulvibacter sp. MAR_2010_11]
MKKSLLLVVVLFSAIVYSQSQNPVEIPKIVIKVALGESAQIGPVIIKFLDVVEDSRCPEYVTCVWAGRVVVNVEVKAKGKPTEIKKLIFGQTKPGESIDNILYSVSGYSLEATMVTPYPKESTNEIKDYALLISENKG